MLRISRCKTALTAVVAAAGLGVAVAQTAGGGTATATPKSGGTSATAGKSSSSASLDRADKKFVEEAAMHGMAEVEMGKVAQQKASNDQVKQFAEKMVQDHGMANDQLKQTASAKGVDVPATLDKKHQGDLDKLQKLSGADFDRAYMKHMLDDHKKDVGEFKKVAKSAKDSEVKSFASSTLPTLEEHLTLAQATNDALKGDKKASASGTTSGSGTTSTGSSAGTSGSSTGSSSGMSSSTAASGSSTGAKK
jgi:putative membrane protein